MWALKLKLGVMEIPRSLTKFEGKIFVPSDVYSTLQIQKQRVGGKTISQHYYLDKAHGILVQIYQDVKPCCY